MQIRCTFTPGDKNVNGIQQPEGLRGLYLLDPFAECV